MNRDRVVTIGRIGAARWAWDVWWRGPSGGGPCAHGTARTRWGARRQAERASYS